MRFFKKLILPLLGGVIFLGVADAGERQVGLASLKIGKTGTFLDNAAEYTNQISANSGPIAKMALANVLFKVPFDQSLNFDGPAVIYILPPFKPGAGQETASILSVKDAAALKKNLAGIYGDPEEKDGAFLYTVPQELPLPDKTLILKIVGDKALLAPNMETLALLDPRAAAEIDNTRAHAEIAISVPGLKAKFGRQIEASLQLGAAMAAEGLDGLKTVTEQLSAIQKALWEIDSVNFSAGFGKDSKTLTLELFIVPQLGTGLGEILSEKRRGVAGKMARLLPPDAPIQVAGYLDSANALEQLKKYQQGAEKDFAIIRALVEMLNEETSAGISLEPFSILIATSDSNISKAAKGAGLYQHALDLALRDSDEKQTVPNSLFGVQEEIVAHNGAEIFLHKPKSKQAGLDNLGGILFKHAQASVDGGVIFSFGENPVASIKTGLDRAKAKAVLTPELAEIFNAPPPGTILLGALRPVELVRLASKGQLPPDLTPQQLTGGLEDAPVSVSVFVNGGKAGLRGTVPGATGGSFFRMYWRLKRANIDVLALAAGLLGSQNVPVLKDAKDVAPPPPPAN